MSDVQISKKRGRPLQQINTLSTPGFSLQEKIISLIPSFQSPIPIYAASGSVVVNNYLDSCISRSTLSFLRFLIDAKCIYFSGKINHGDILFYYNLSGRLQEAIVYRHDLDGTIYIYDFSNPDEMKIADCKNWYCFSRISR